MWLQECTFIGSSAPPFPELPTFLADNRGSNGAQGVFYSDPLPSDICVHTGQNVSSEPPPCEASDPLPLAEAGDSFLTSNDSWFQEQQQVGCFTLKAINRSKQLIQQTIVGGSILSSA